MSKLSIQDNRYLVFLEILLNEKEKQKKNMSLLEKAQEICKSAQAETKQDNTELEMQYF